jgi:hypothetical protein
LRIVHEQLSVAPRPLSLRPLSLRPLTPRRLSKIKHEGRPFAVNGFTATARPAAHKVRAVRANAHAADLAPILKELQAAGITSLNGIDAALNERHVPTPAGSGHWHPARADFEAAGG